MGFKEILKRIKKLEARCGSDEMVTLIVLENGKECRRTMPIVEATLLILQQDAASMFGTADDVQGRIIGVESGDDDGFIQAIFESEKIDPGEVKALIEE